MINKKIAEQIVDSQFRLKLNKISKEYVNEIMLTTEYKDLLSKKLKERKEKGEVEELNKNLDIAEKFIKEVIPVLNPLFNKYTAGEKQETIYGEMLHTIGGYLGYSWTVSNLIIELYENRITRDSAIKNLEDKILESCEYLVKDEMVLSNYYMSDIIDNILIKLQNMISLSKEQAYENIIDDINSRVNLKKEISELHQLKRDLKDLQ